MICLRLSVRDYCLDGVYLGDSLDKLDELEYMTSYHKLLKEKWKSKQLLKLENTEIVFESK